MMRKLVNPPHQWSLFDNVGQTNCETKPPAIEFDPNKLTDQEIIEQIPKAKLSNIKLLCEQIEDRNLDDKAVPALLSLWNRYKGFGLVQPLLEQRLALQTLLAINTSDAKDTLYKIITEPNVPDSLLPTVLETAIGFKLKLTLRQIMPWLKHEMPIIRALAFSLMQYANPPLDVLEIGLSDPEASVRKSALITMGNLGHEDAREGLMAEFGKNPTGQTAKALFAVADDDVITRLGRYAIENQKLRKLIANELNYMDNPKATKIAKRIQDHLT
jgi:HEAT repeat protein